VPGAKCSGPVCSTENSNSNNKNHDNNNKHNDNSNNNNNNNSHMIRMPESDSICRHLVLFKVIFDLFVVGFVVVCCCLFIFFLTTRSNGKYTRKTNQFVFQETSGETPDTEAGFVIFLLGAV
jgi:hypothetical protein